MYFSIVIPTFNRLDMLLRVLDESTTEVFIVGVDSTQDVVKREVIAAQCGRIHFDHVLFRVAAP